MTTNSNHHVINIETNERTITNDDKIKYNCKIVFYVISFLLLIVPITILVYNMEYTDGFLNDHHMRSLNDKEDLDFIENEKKNREINIVIMVYTCFIIIIIFTFFCNVNEF